MDSYQLPHPTLVSLNPLPEPEPVIPKSAEQSIRTADCKMNSAVSYLAHREIIAFIFDSCVKREPRRRGLRATRTILAR